MIDAEGMKEIKGIKGIKDGDERVMNGIMVGMGVFPCLRPL